VSDAVVTIEGSRLTRWRWTITGAFGLGGITVSAWGPRLPAIKASLGVGTGTIGLLLAGVTVGAIGGLVAIIFGGAMEIYGLPLALAVPFALAIGASIVAGLLPAWKACDVSPASQLKSS